ncbi:unnamed protein product [Paramecium pentaurelia]|uniref:UBC core domain-containing protein n=1 Tax=Paramecium pentaurelia TaxID=43138 RepID=A0A8S1Y3J6_9CILI|nr:unnamed protein product [Paramecium pentaurelia]
MQQKLIKELKELTIDSPLPGVKIISYPEARLIWTAIMEGPEGTPYQGGHFEVLICFPENYPFKPPKFYFQTKIFHPNIGEDGRLCAYCFLPDSDWQPTNTVKYALEKILNLLRNVNFNDDLNQKAMNMYHEDKNKFEEFARIETIMYAT